MNDILLPKRRQPTKTSGYSTHPDSTGRNYKIEKKDSFFLNKNQSIKIEFLIPPHNIGDLVAFGGWFFCDKNIKVHIQKGGFVDTILIIYQPLNWSKFGSIGVSDTTNNVPTTSITFTALEDTNIAFHNIDCGTVYHEEIERVRNDAYVEKQLDNIHTYAPEGNFYQNKGKIIVYNQAANMLEKKIDLYLKSCNRCARFLPININNEKSHLSFSNHKRFNTLKHEECDDALSLKYGYQLECRICKKLFVNIPLNKQRTIDQLREDSARRRAMESLLTELYKKSHLLSYKNKHRYGGLATDTWIKFNKRCFKCDIELNNPKDMHLDHTRPLSLLWPLDETATCLCEICNSQKSNKLPSEYYLPEEIEELSSIIGLSISDLTHAKVNLEAVKLILDNIEWLISDFCFSNTLQKDRDGKITAEIFLTSLQRTLDETEYGKNYNLLQLYQDVKK
ncbi:hypothetical protein [Alkanindiges illinoisensis]|uniref:hypothetical protein n=1 Tax=Alkanindiges illinoisensis TaxID=197183 RepID=UPI00047A7964|nr:hypothetical protein [Alkanindiges illinoisensis]